MKKYKRLVLQLKKSCLALLAPVDQRACELLPKLIVYSGMWIGTWLHALKSVDTALAGLREEDEWDNEW